MPAYLIVEAEITDPERFAAYARANPALVARHGGRYLALRTQAEALEGEALGPRKLVISEWPDRDAAWRYWNSPEYAELKRLREGTGRFRVLLVEGNAAPGG